MVRVVRSPVSHVSLEEQFDRLAAEASGLADQGVLYTDKFPGKQACVEKIEADEAATGDAWYDEEEEEEAMLHQEEERAEGAVADEEEALTNANSSTAPSSSAAANASSSAAAGSRKLHICLACACFCSCEEQVVGSQDCMWYSQKDLERMSKR